MRNYYKSVVIIVCTLAFLTAGLNARSYSAFGMVGYLGGSGFQGGVNISDFADGFPFSVQGSVSYSKSDPGKALDTRKIFINDATNGDPQKNAHAWNLRLDLLYPVRWFSLKQAFVFGGPRYSGFNGNFNFVGGNEDYDITSSQWGWGLGMRSSFPISQKLDFSVSAGADYFMAATLEGHDTIYSPDGEHVNARNDYGFKDADNAVNQPKLEMHLLFGIDYNF